MRGSKTYQKFQNRISRELDGNFYIMTILSPGNSRLEFNLSMLFRNDKIAIRLYFDKKTSSRIDLECNLDLWIVVKFETSENWISRSD